MHLVSGLLDEPSLKAFARDTCLKGLERFQMCEDRNEVPTTGLLYMEDSWETAYLWENAEAALAYFEAATDLRSSGRSEEESCFYERCGLTILRAIARHHHGPHGFLTEGVDWNNHVGEKHHFDGAEFGDIQYTEPFLNGQHIVAPTVFYIENLAVPDACRLEDCEGNLLLERSSDDA